MSAPNEALQRDIRTAAIPLTDAWWGKTASSFEDLRLVLNVTMRELVDGFERPHGWPRRLTVGWRVRLESASTADLGTWEWNPQEKVPHGTMEIICVATGIRWAGPSVAAVAADAY